MRYLLVVALAAGALVCDGCQKKPKPAATGPVAMTPKVKPATVPPPRTAPPPKPAPAPPSAPRHTFTPITTTAAPPTVTTPAAKPTPKPVPSGPITTTVTPPEAAPTGGAVYVVRPGDTLWGIATRQLGSGKRWKEIAALNPGVNPSKLPVGAKLNMPR